MSPTSQPPSAPAKPDVSRVFGDPRFHADGEISALTFADDGTLWTIEEPGILRQWKTSGVPVQRHFLSDLETLWVFSEPGQLLASASDDLSLWDLDSCQRITTVPQPSWVTMVAFSHCLTQIATGHDDGKVRVWDIASQQQLCELSGHDRPVSALAFTRDGTRLASAAEDRIIQVWEIPSGKKLNTLTGHTDRIPALAWHPQGHRLVSAGWDTTARVWDLVSGEPVILLNSHADQVHSLAFSPDGRVLACADSACSVHLWHAVAWKTIHVLNEHKDEVRSLAFSPDSQHLASAGAEGVVHLWDVQRGELISGRNGASRHSLSLVSTKAGVRLASTCGGSALRSWDVATAQPIIAEESAGILSVTGSADGRWIASGGADAHITLWNAVTGEPHLSLFGPRGPAGTLALAPHRPVLASASSTDGLVWLWNWEKAEPILIIPEAADGCTVEALAFHPHKNWLACGGIDWLATGGTDGATCLWDLDQPGKIWLFEQGTTSLSFHPTGKLLAAASLGEVVYLYDLDAQQIAAELPGHREGVTCVAFSPDGRWLASGSDDRTLRLWDATSRELIAQQELDTHIKAVGFSPDNQFVFTGNGNTTCYQLEVAKLLEE